MKEKNGNIPLPTQKSSRFEVYYKWLYSGKMDDLASETHSDWEEGFELYFLGDALLDEHFRNALIDTMAERITVAKCLPLDHTLVNLVFDNTLEKDILQKLLVDMWAYLGHPSPSWYKYRASKVQTAIFHLDSYGGCCRHSH